MNLNVFYFLLFEWWIVLRWSTWTDWTCYAFIFILLTPSVVILLIILLFPQKIEAGLDF